MNADLFVQRDPHGIIMAIIAISIVMMALILIFLSIKGFGMLMIRFAERKAAKAATAEAATAPKRKPVLQKMEEEIAAAALALKMYQEEQHIKESTVITINRASRVYSPWSSKIHGIPATPVKN